MRPIYVETLVRAGLDELWELTQAPAAHQRWDLRFSEITYLPGTPQRFRYAVRPLPGVVVAGTGICGGETRRNDGGRVSALRFATSSRLSPVRSGSGYWRYQPVPGGVRFWTGYTYRPGWGRPVDVLFRPLMGWATAWSFDRLRLWAERGQTPELSVFNALAELAVRLSACLMALELPAFLGAIILGFACLLPPLPSTPAARRCLRRPPERRSDPDLLSRSDEP